MSSPFPIFVINLKRSPHRKANISKQLDALNLDYQFIEAVDGTQFTPYKVVEKYGEQVFCTNTYNHQRMTLGSLGCLLSHIKFYELMIDNNIPIACVLEDDAEVSPLFPEVLNSTALQKVSWGTLLLGHYSKYRKSYNKGAEAVYWKKKVCPGHHIARVAEFPFTTIGYLIKLSTAKKLRDLAYPIRMPADWVTGNTELVGDVLRIITPPCIVSNKDYRQESTVREGSDTEVPIELQRDVPEPNKDYRKKSTTGNGNTTKVPVELQRETPSLSLMRNLTVGLANCILGTREQRAAAAYDLDEKPSTYRPIGWRLTQSSRVNKTLSGNRKASTHRPTKWRLTQDSQAKKSLVTDGVDSKTSNSSTVDRNLEPKLKQKTHALIQNMKTHQARHIGMLSKKMRRRWSKQKTLWRKMKKSDSTKTFLTLALRLVSNILIIFFGGLYHLIQNINRTIYYGKKFTTIRIYIKKIGLFRYTRVV